MQMPALELQRFFDSFNHTLGMSFIELQAFVSWIKALEYKDISIIDRTCALLGVDVGTYLQEYRPYLGVEKIRRMHGEGFTIGAHSKTHRKLGELGEDEIESEIVESCHFIQEITAQEVIPFSFPHSAWGIDRAILVDIRERNPLIGLMFDTKGLRQDLNFIVNRIWAERPLGGDAGLSSISQLLNTAYRDQMNEAVINWGRKLARGDAWGKS
jgi:hypothetical protein